MIDGDENKVIPYEIAKLAKEAGFDEGVRGSYIDHHDGAENNRGESIAGTVGLNLYDYIINCKIDYSNEYYTYYAAPTREILNNWLIEKHQIFVDVVTDRTTAPKFATDVNRFVGNPKDLSEREWYWETIEHERFLFRNRLEAWDNGLYSALTSLIPEEKEV